MNGSLTHLNGLNNVADITGKIWVRYNGSLIDLEGLNHCKRIQEGIEISNNNSLESLSGLDSLQVINSSFAVFLCSDLDSLSGLKSLKVVNGNIQLYENNSLASLTGIDSLVADSIDNVYITNNSNLSTCHVYSICNFLENPPAGAVINIQNNDSGCSSIEEVLAACATVEIDNAIVAVSSLLYPNPVNSFLVVNCALFEKPGASCTIRDLNGRVVAFFGDIKETNKHQIINTSSWPPGMYVCIINFGDFVKVEKIIKN